MKHLDEVHLNAYFDRELGGEALREAEAHLAGCKSCRQALSELEGVANALADLPDEALRGDLRAQVMARLPQPRLHTGWKLVLAAQSGAVLGVGLLVLQNLSERVRPQDWLEGATAGLLRMAPSLPKLPIHLSFSFPTLNLQPSSAALIFLAVAAALLWSVGNAVLLGKSREVRK
jgi:anti-sigma factor RsiW